MGSEFTYDDLGGYETAKYDYKLLKEYKKGKDTFWDIEQKSKDKSVTDYQIIHLNKTLMGPESVEFYNGKKEKVKESTLEGFQSYKVKNKTYHRPGKITMRNLQNNKESIFQWKKREFGAKQKASDFNPQSLDVKK